MGQSIIILRAIGCNVKYLTASLLLTCKKILTSSEQNVLKSNEIDQDIVANDYIGAIFFLKMILLLIYQNSFYTGRQSYIYARVMVPELDYKEFDYIAKAQLDPLGLPNMVEIAKKSIGTTY